MKHIEVFYGEMGSGKTFMAKEMLALNYAKADFFEGDDVVTEEMMEYVRKFLPIPKEILDNYIYHHFIPEIVLRAQNSKKDILYVAQALYRKEHRDFLKEYLTKQGFSVSMTEIKTSFIKNAKQLMSREHGARWVAYWLVNKPFFQRD